MGIIPAPALEALSVDQREEKWNEILSLRRSETWVAEEDGVILGFASAAGSSRDQDADARTGELWALYVDPDRWRMGVGQQLWREVVTHLERSGCTDVNVWVLERNRRAIAFYETVGFRAEEQGATHAIKEVELGGVVLGEIRLRARVPSGGSLL